MIRFLVPTATTTALLCLGTGLGFAPAAEAAAAGGIYDLRVVTSGMAFHINDPNLVLSPDVAFGPYAAAASLDNLGASTAVAGAPFLGDYVGPLTGQLNGLGSGQIPPFPPIPGEVRSSYPGQPSGSQENRGYSIQATSSENQSKALVNLGPMAPGASNATLFSLADALVDRDGTLNAVGSAGVDLLNLGGVLDIGRVASSITMHSPRAGRPTYTTATDVGTITVAGQTFGLNQDGLTAGSTKSGSSADQVNAATAALTQAGISIRYIPATTTYLPGTHTVQSMQSGAVAVSYQHEVPSQGLTTTTYTLGYVALSTTTPDSGSSQAAHIANAASAPSGARVGSVTARMPTPHATSGAGAPAGSAAVRGAPGMAPSNKDAADGSGSSAAIITPTLKILRFGATTGTPDTCNILFGILGTGAQQAGAGAGSAPAFAQAIDQCTTQSTSWGDQISGAMPQVAPLAAINPVVDPGIDAFADGLQSIGRDQAQYVAPFGPTLVGMADSARFFKGGTSAGPTS